MCPLSHARSHDIARNTEYGASSREKGSRSTETATDMCGRWARGDKWAARTWPLGGNGRRIISAYASKNASVR